MSICIDCANKAVCKNFSYGKSRCHSYAGDKYWCISSSEWPKFYTKADSPARAKYALFLAVKQRDRRFNYQFSDILNADLKIRQINSHVYNFEKTFGKKRWF